MGAYLSQPITETSSDDAKNSSLSYGSSSMQGWRVSQEDAHCCLLNYDSDDVSLFGVFDGHGGAEVAQLTASTLPRLLKSLNSYKAGDYRKSLEEAFLEFDASLLTPDVLSELKILAGSPDDADHEEERKEAALLREEANIPLEDIIAKYGQQVESDKLKRLPLHLRREVGKDEKPMSPYLRAKKSDSVQDDEIGTMSGVGSSSPKDNCEPCCSSTSYSNQNSNGELNKSNEVENSEPTSSKLTDAKPEPVSSSSSSSADLKFSTKNGETPITSTKQEPCQSSDIADVSDSTKFTNSSKDDSEIKNDDVVSSSEACATRPQTKKVEDVSSEATVVSSSKLKGKQKKVVTPARSSQRELGPTYNTLFTDLDDESDNSDDSGDDFQIRASSESEEENDENEEDEDDDDESSDEEEEEEDEDEDDECSPCDSGAFEEPGKDSGCTAVVALVRNGHLYVANAGDSRCVVSCSGKAVDMSIDHKPEDELERQRVENAGGKVTSDGRVNNGLNLSRAIGDHAYKDNPKLGLKEQMISSFPDVKQLTLEPSKHEFMVLACDGIWNSMSSQQVVDFVSERINKMEKLSEICEELFFHCLSPSTAGDGTGCDNMTCIIIRFDNLPGKRKADDDEEASDGQALNSDIETKRQRIN